MHQRALPSSRGTPLSGGHRRIARSSERPIPSRLPPEVTPLTREVVIPVDIVGFAEIAERVFSTPLIDPDVDHLDLDLPSVQDAMLDLQGRMASVITISFEDVVAHCTRDAEVIAYFLALLELARWGIVRVNQDDGDAQIALAYDQNAADQRFRAILDSEGAS